MKQSSSAKSKPAYVAGIEIPSFSDLRLFDTCPRLWYEQNVTKEYEQPEEDYFIYGSLVDAMLTDPESVEKRFCKVARRVKDGTGMELIGEMKALEAEIQALEADLAKKDNRVKAKGLAARKLKLEALSKDVKAIRSNGDKTQVVPSIWDNAVETADAIKRNPLWVEIEQMAKAGCAIFQHQMYAPDIALKGTPDVILGSKSALALLKLYATGNTELEYVRETYSIDPTPFTIVDIKTCARLTEFDPKKYYAGQLATYRAMIQSITGAEDVSCLILAGDKDPNRKLAQDYAFTREDMDRALQSVARVRDLFREAIAIGTSEAFPAAKHLYGREQTCLRCSECKERPYSSNGPLIV